jgi:hypothetical protein
MNSKPVLVVLVSGLLGLLVACEPAGPSDIKLTAPPGAESPKSSKTHKSRRLTYTVAQSEIARDHAVRELAAQGFVRCENGRFTPWGAYVAERDGKRINTRRQVELMFLRQPPRVATIELVRLPDGVGATVEVEQILTGEVVESERARFCRSLPTR